MLPSYEDITKRLGQPKFYDEHGVPRYDEFTPQLCGIYNSYIALLEVACQSCDKRFFVAREISSLDGKVTLPIKPSKDGDELIKEVEDVLDDTLALSPWDIIGSFHYGDPPRHGDDTDECISGSTMNSIPIRIIEFWKRGEYNVWERDHSYEFTLPELKRDSDE